MNWPNMRDHLAPLRMRWDLAVLANLADSDGPIRPADLIKSINAQSRGEQISWKTLEARLRRLGADGYLARQEVLHVPRETRYWLLPRGHQLISALSLLETLYSDGGHGPEVGIPSG